MVFGLEPAFVHSSGEKSQCAEVGRGWGYQGELGRGRGSGGGRVYVQYMAHLTGMEGHFEFLKVVPPLGFAFLKIMVNIPRTEPKGMKFSVWSQEEGGRGLLVAHPWVSSLPLSHHVDAVRVTREGERVPAVGRAEVDGRYHEVLVGRCVRRGDHARRSNVSVVSVVSVVTIVAYVVVHRAVQRHFYAPRSLGKSWAGLDGRYYCLIACPDHLLGS